jgi:4-hydroxy-tetrahydrodipicolinate synthase
MIVPHPRCRLQGSFVALVTPFKDGEIDYAALQALIDWHVAQGTDGLVIAGTTGESATLTENERRALFEAAIGVARHRLPMIAGVGTNATRQTVELARFAAGLGYDGLLAVTPYYNKPGPRGLALHYSALAEAVSTPIVLYNVPSRTGVDLQPETVAEVARRYPHVVAVKEALASLERVKRLIGETEAAVLCGEDSAIADFIGLGAVGVIGVVNNIAPAAVAELVRASVPSSGKSVRAAELVEYLAPLCRDLFIESSPVPVKAALAKMGRCSAEVRLPLAPLSEASGTRLDATLRAAKLIR